MKATIFEIKRFAVHDGDGIRTTVFYKGCPLRCRWCHNPEGLSQTPQIAYYAHKCIGCLECTKICPTSVHVFRDGAHILQRDLCTACGHCAEVCLGDALTAYGKEMSTEELLPILLEDRDFYAATGGGITLSGGECLLQAEACAELLAALKAEGIHTAVDTCGAVPQENIRAVVPFTDVFLYDLKAYDEKVHIRCTGYSNARILENLRYLDSIGKPVEIRIPYVPDCNANEIEKIAHFLKDLRNVTKIRLLAYHNYAGSKYEALSLPSTLPATLPIEDELVRMRARILEITERPVSS